MFSIAPYSIQLLDEERQPVDLWKFSGVNNLRQVLIEYFQDEMRTYKQISTNRVFRVAQLLEGESTTVAGKYETGEYGFKSNLYDVSAKKISHNKKTSEADMLPFPFLFVLPQSDLAVRRQNGMLLLARHKTFGVRTITIPHLKAYIEARFPGFQFNAARIFPAAQARSLLDKGILKGITLVKYRMPNALEDLLDQTDKAELQQVEIVFKSKRKSGFLGKSKLMGLLEGRGNYRGLYESPDFACDNVKLDIELGGRKRRIDIGRQRVSSNVEITDDVEVDLSGFPTLQSWFDQADDLAMSLHSSMGVEITLQTSVKKSS